MPRCIPLAALAVTAALAPIAALSAPPPPAAQGVYTDEQARQGGALYAANCAMCHGAALEGTFENPPLQGKFVANWGRSPVSALFDYVSHAMPQMAPGSLSPDDNARIVAFLLQRNGMRAGPTPLPASAEKLKSIRFEPANR